MTPLIRLVSEEVPKAVRRPLTSHIIQIAFCKVNTFFAKSFIFSLQTFIRLSP